MSLTDISGVYVNQLPVTADDRGSLMEIFRTDELPELYPPMAYLSVTLPNRSRGPHEHVSQTDIFVFLGPADVLLWDNRPDSETYGMHRILLDTAPGTQVIVPPGVVHAYRNRGPDSVMIANAPTSLYAGYGRNEDVDEIRHEDDEDSPFSFGSSHE
ncbi:MAG: FdtA/QdtA family cupin domain-containing protein [Bacteroidales bacterium]|nr:FdtA/QdtA family cupin domain-containing protein [Candidatus Latescibacterota bacterium]